MQTFLDEANYAYNEFLPSPKRFVITGFLCKGCRIGGQWSVPMVVFGQTPLEEVLA